MEKTLDKELISHLLMLEKDQQEDVLGYIKKILSGKEMDRRAGVSEQSIAEGKVKTFDQFNSSFENWKKQKRTATR
ncbi:MAG: hypothetical protein OEY51_11965 [Cyclobacteriaceae bacterium]|nr:hypothetical protein [Cyclobacteriaceae bacterium]